jgi:NitT/TauT family transport system ATP-binding protein
VRGTPPVLGGVSWAIRVRDAGKVFVREDDSVVDVLDRLSLEIAEGSFVTIVGRSGCGKSTLLNMVAGLVEPSSGSIEFSDGTSRRPHPQVGYLTQKDTLLPWRSVLRNVAMPLEIRGVGKAERDRRAHELLELVGLRGWEDRYPRELSGGMLRRASLARMLASEPRLLLLDEPFGALDAQLRAELQAELLRLWNDSGKTVVFVTHDIDEALTLADRIVVLRRGGQIALDVDVAFPRPREGHAVRTAPDFVALHERLLGAIA